MTASIEIPELIQFLRQELQVLSFTKSKLLILSFLGLPTGT